LSPYRIRRTQCVKQIVLALHAVCAAIPLLIGVVFAVWAPSHFFNVSLIPAARADEMADEVKIGKTAEDELAKKTKFVTDPAQNARVQGIVAKLALIADNVQVPARFGNDKVFKFNYHVKIIDAPDINAFSLPGGGLYIYRGLLDLLQGDDELAGVLGHEMAHAAHHHVMQLTHEAEKIDTQTTVALLTLILAKVPADQVAGIGTTLQYGQMAKLNNHFSENAERDADYTGMIYLTKAGYNPLGMLSLLQHLHDVEDRSLSLDLGFLQDHPLTPERIAAAKQELTTLGYKVDPEALRLVANFMKTRATDITVNGSPALKVSFGNRELAILPLAHRSEAEAAKVILDNFVAKNGQAFRVKSEGSTVYVSGQILFAFTPEDAAIARVKTTPEEMASVCKQTILEALWEISVEGIDAK
jgi:predicted Zn-dependent protease